MKVRLTIQFTEQTTIRWRSRIQSDLEMRSVQEVAHNTHEEVFFFDAETHIEAENIKRAINKWTASDPISHLEVVGHVSYEVEVIEKENCDGC